MPTDRVVEYDNAGIPKLFSIELLRRKREIEGLPGHIYGIFATPRNEAMRIFAEERRDRADRPHHRPAILFPINGKIEEYWDDVWRQMHRDRKLIYSTEILGIPYRVFVRIGRIRIPF
jgi:hypothetical protein